MNALETINQARDALTVKRVYGEPYQEDGITVIPAAHVMGGGGGGADTQGNGGGGFGLSARPAGAWVIKDGDAVWRPAIDINRAVLGGQLVAIVIFLSLRSGSWWYSTSRPTRALTATSTAASTVEWPQVALKSPGRNCPSWMSVFASADSGITGFGLPEKASSVSVA